MSQRIVSFALVLVLIFMTAGCGTKPATLTIDDNDKTVSAKVGGQITIELEGNPSTGYTWEEKDVDTSILKQEGEVEFKSSNPGLIGSGGTMTLTFKAVKAGTTALNLIYHRPWETDVKPESTFSVTVVVK
jgi:inhibitor of cysteine peptidase